MKDGERERALRMGVGYYRARKHQSLRGPAEEEGGGLGYSHGWLADSWQ